MVWATACVGIVLAGTAVTTPVAVAPGDPGSISGRVVGQKLPGTIDVDPGDHVDPST